MWFSSQQREKLKRWGIQTYYCSGRVREDFIQVLANRLRYVLGIFIDDHQSGFLRGRSILDSIASIQEVIQFTKWNKIPEFMLKLDFEKAYNTVEWDCILKTLQSWRFAPSWISWIRLWLQTVKVTVLVNGV